MWVGLGQGNFQPVDWVQAEQSLQAGTWSDVVRLKEYVRGRRLRSAGGGDRVDASEKPVKPPKCGIRFLHMSAHGGFRPGTAAGLAALEDFCKRLSRLGQSASDGRANSERVASDRWATLLCSSSGMMRIGMIQMQRAKYVP